MYFNDLFQIEQITAKFQSFHNSLVISIGLFLILTTVLITVENLFHKVEKQLISSDKPSYLVAKPIIWIIELITTNLIFFVLGSFAFSSITHSSYMIYQVAFSFNLIFTLLKFILKIYHLVRS